MVSTRRGERFGPSAALGGVIRERRKELGLSQEALAREAALDRTYVGGLERGERNPTLRVLWKLAVALQLSSSELMKRTEARL